ncbi:hypothetical protein ACQ86D_26340 [Streptomyces galilaeus]
MLKNRAARRAAYRRHQKLLAAARQIVSRHAIEGTVTHVGPAEVVALVFGRHAMRIAEAEAVEYLNAVLVDRGFPLRSMDAPLPVEGVYDRSGRCPAVLAHDPSPCDGAPAVTVLNSQNEGVDGCERHAARLLAVLTDGRPVALPEAPEGAALRVFAAAGELRLDGGGQ